MADLPDKLYYSIREVAAHTGVEPHVLRYWESEFPSLRPRRNRAGTRTYRRRDVDEILAIKTLLHDEGYRIDGARKALRDRQKEARADAAPPPPQPSLDFRSLDRPARVAALRKELEEVLALLRGMAPGEGD
ncbi:MAG TPA: MerR family transcriptional regulator [Candidatus Krumholzibacteria bacterium]|nr:MerR family transcriptional regulator [Candidatus Krumholzibacteria bacterium]HRX52061.1 MerR family transcriptional regulator [Candidatus Krumholzibacteria bacterium]